MKVDDNVVVKDAMEGDPRGKGRILRIYEGGKIASVWWNMKTQEGDPPAGIMVQTENLDELEVIND